jgi:hypothetical protein
MRLIATIGVWLVLAAGAAAQEQNPPPEPEPAEPAVTWGGEVDFLSQYVWRGFQYSEGKVLWPTAWVSAKGFTATLFFNYDPAWDPKWNEYDLTFTYERSVGRWNLAGTYTRYVYYEEDRRDATSEIIARVGFAAGPGEIFTTHAFDVELYKGSYYLEVGYALEKEIDDKSSITADASVAFWSKFIDKYTEGTDDHLTGSTVGPLALNVSYVRSIAPYLAIRPHISFFRIADDAGQRLLEPPGAVVGIALVVGK